MLPRRRYEQRSRSTVPGLGARWRISVTRVHRGSMSTVFSTARAVEGLLLPRDRAPAISP